MKWLVLLLVVGGLVLASGPAMAQGDEPSALQKLYWQELAKYDYLINQYHALVAAGTSGGPQHAPPPAARRLLHQIFAQGKKVEGLAKALAAQQAGQSGSPPGQ